MTKSTIKFTKENLQRLKASSKPKWHYAENFEGLALYAGKQKKTYYAHWSKPFTDKSTGKIKFIGKRKRIGGFHIPLDEIKEKVRKNLDEWKKTAAAADGGCTIGGLVKQFLDHGSTGYRVKTKGAKIKYKKKTSKSYNHLLNTYILLKTKKQSIISMLIDPFRFNGGNGYVTGALKDISLNKVTKRDIEIWHTRMEPMHTTANRALAALSVAFEWDMKRSTARLYKGDSNPCLRISKYQETKDKNYLQENILKEIRDYCLNETWRDPHFLTFYMITLEVGERLEDLYKLVWQKPRSQKEINNCRGWINFEKGEIHLTDSKDRQSADVPLTDPGVKLLKQLQKYRVERKECSFALESQWVFPRATDPSLPINESSYRVKLKYFNYKFGLATRELIRSKRTRKLYKYKNIYTFKHLRKTFCTFYARGKNEDGSKRGLEQASLRMRHSSPKVTKDHYFTEDQQELRAANIFDNNVIDLKKKEQK